MSATRRRKSQPSDNILADQVLAYARLGDSLYVGIGKQLRLVDLRSGDEVAKASLEGDVDALAVSAGGVVAAAGARLAILDLDLKARRSVLAGGPIMSIVAGPRAAWARGQRREVVMKSKGILGQPMAAVMNTSVQRLDLDGTAADKAHPLGEEWLPLSNDAVPGFRLDLAGLAGDEAVALVSTYDDLLVMRRGRQRIVRFPAAGEPTTSERTAQPWATQLLVHEGSQYWATKAGLSREQSMLLQGTGGSGEWIPTRHGMFAVWVTDAGAATVLRLLNEGTLSVVLQQQGQVPPTFLGRDAIIEDDSGLWLTFTGEGNTRFVNLDPGGDVVRKVEQPGSSYPIGVVGDRFYALAVVEADQAPDGKATAAVTWQPLPG